jgi:hypothetical protein
MPSWASYVSYASIPVLNCTLRYWLEIELPGHLGPVLKSAIYDERKTR